MEQRIESHRSPRADARGDSPEGRYIYCVVRTDEEVCLGPIGVEEHDVYGVTRDGLCALVHDCPERPYKSGDGEDAASWVMAHHRVVNTAWRRWRAVLPIAFNTVISAGGDCAEVNLKAWLKREHSSLAGRLDSLSGKAEYGVQAFWDPAVIAGKVAGDSPEIRGIEERARHGPRGTTYLYRQKLGRALRDAMETRAAETFKELHAGLAACVDNTRVEKSGQAEEGRQMLMNLTCLVSLESYHRLSTELDRIGEREGFFVRLVGPLPPYSFC